MTVIIDRSLVDGEVWYRVRSSVAAAQWLRDNYKDQKDRLWFDTELIDWTPVANVIDMHEQLYTIFALRWSEHA